MKHHYFFGRCKEGKDEASLFFGRCKEAVEKL